MRYACLIYFDTKKVFDQSPEAEEVLRDSMDPNNEVRAGGHIVTEGPLQLPDQAITLQGCVTASTGGNPDSTVLMHAPRLEGSAESEHR